MAVEDTLQALVDLLGEGIDHRYAAPLETGLHVFGQQQRATRLRRCVEDQGM